MPYVEEVYDQNTRDAIDAQANTVLRCACGGTYIHDPRPFEWNPRGECDRCGRKIETEAQVCGECAALFEWFDGPVPSDCPGCSGSPHDDAWHQAREREHLETSEE